MKNWILIGLMIVMIMICGCGETVRRTTDYKTKIVEISDTVQYLQTNYDSLGVTTNFTTLFVNRSGYVVKKETRLTVTSNSLIGDMRADVDSLGRVVAWYDYMTDEKTEDIEYVENSNKEATHNYYVSNSLTTCNVFEYLNNNLTQKNVYDVSGGVYTMNHYETFDAPISHIVKSYSYDSLNNVVGWTQYTYTLNNQVQNITTHPAGGTIETYDYTYLNSGVIGSYKINGVLQYIVVAK